MSLQSLEVPSPEARFFTATAFNHLRDTTGVRNGVRVARSDPRILQPALDGLSGVINSLNEFIDLEKEPNSFQKEVLPNSCLLRGYRRSSSRVMPLPTLEQLVDSRACGEVFRVTNSLMRAGEHGETPGWSFHLDITDPSQLADALALEIYGLRVFPDRSSVIVRALEEMLAIYHPDSRMFGSIKQYLTEEEGFSAGLIALAKNEIPDTLRDNSVVAETDCFRADVRGGKLLIVPTGFEGKSQMNSLLDVPELCVPVYFTTQEFEPAVVVPAGRIDLTPDNLRTCLVAGRVKFPNGFEVSLAMKK